MSNVTSNEQAVRDEMSDTISTEPGAAPSIVLSEQSAVSEEKENLKATLAEARTTAAMLNDFDTAIKNGSYSGHQMMAVAKGLAFVEAIIRQNKAHIKNLQEKI